MGHAVFYDDFKEPIDKQKIRDYVNSRSVDEGDYHSSVNTVRFYNSVLDSREEAEEFIERHDSFYGCLAVRYRHQCDFKGTKALVLLKKRLDVATKNLHNLNMSPHFAKCKSSLVSCSTCGSKIAKKYILSGNYCPACKADMRPDTVRQRIAKMRESVAELENLFSKMEREERQKSLDKADVYWLVKTEFHT